MTLELLIFGIILLVMFIYFVFRIGKSDKETQKYLDMHYHKVGNFYVRNNLAE